MPLVYTQTQSLGSATLCSFVYMQYIRNSCCQVVQKVGVMLATVGNSVIRYACMCIALVLSCLVACSILSLYQLAVQYTALLYIPGKIVTIILIRRVIRVRASLWTRHCMLHYENTTLHAVWYTVYRSSYLSFVKHSTAKQEWLPLLRPLQNVQHALQTP